MVHIAAVSCAGARQGVGTWVMVSVMSVIGLGASVILPQPPSRSRAVPNSINHLGPTVDSRYQHGQHFLIRSQQVSVHHELQHAAKPHSIDAKRKSLIESAIYLSSCKISV